MSFDIPPKPHSSSELPREAVDAQVEKICLSEYFDGPLRPHLLRFMVKRKFDGFFRRRPQPGRKELRDDFYNWAGAELGLGPPGDIEMAGKKLLNELTHALEEYYRGPGCDDDIVITIPSGKGKLPDPQITSKALTLSSDSGPVVHPPAEPGRGSIYKKLTGLPVHLYHLTKDVNGRPVWYYNSLRVGETTPGRAGGFIL